MSSPAVKVAVLGAGSWGTALASLIARHGQPTILWGRDAAVAEAIDQRHENPRYLPGIPLPDALRATTDLASAVREADLELHELLSGIEDRTARAVSRAERALLAALDGSCRTPIGGHARLLPGGELHLTGLVARPDGSFLLKRSLHGAAGDAERIGRELGESLRADSPADIFIS